MRLLEVTKHVGTHLQWPRRTDSPQCCEIRSASDPAERLVIDIDVLHLPALKRVDELGQLRIRIRRHRKRWERLEKLFPPWKLYTATNFAFWRVFGRTSSVLHSPG